MPATTKITVFQLLSSYFAVVKTQEASRLFQDIQKSFIELERLGYLIENIDFCQYVNCIYSQSPPFQGGGLCKQASIDQSQCLPGTTLSESRHLRVLLQLGALSSVIKSPDEVGTV
ncbi:MAG: hypothetical protein ACFFDI_15890 [Promethearchaeota archaeon]